MSISSLAPVNYRALTDPNYVEKWDPVELTPEERQAFMSLLTQRGDKGTAFDHFLNAAPSFGHLRAYITTLKEKIPQGCSNRDRHLFLESFMGRVCTRLIRSISLRIGEEYPIIFETSMQNCLLGIISNFHCCYENIWSYEEDKINVSINIPNCNVNFKVYRLAYLMIRLIGLFETHKDDPDRVALAIQIESLQTIQQHFAEGAFPSVIGTMINLLNRGFSIDQTFVDAGSLELLLNPPMFKWLMEQPLFPSMEMFFRKLVEAELNYDLKILPLAVNTMKEICPFSIGKLNEHLEGLIDSILDKYKSEGVFEIKTDIVEECLYYLVAIHKTDGKIQGEEALAIIDRILPLLIPSDTEYEIAAEALSPELIKALPKKAAFVEIKESQPQPWAIKADLIRHFNECKRFLISVKSITSELLNNFQETNFETIDWLAILTPDKFGDLTQEQLLLYDKFMGMIPPGKGTIEFPLDGSHKLPLTDCLLGMIADYPKLGIVMLEQRLRTNRLTVPKTEQEIILFVRMLTLCLENPILHKWLMESVNNCSQQELLSLLNYTKICFKVNLLARS